MESAETLSGWRDTVRPQYYSNDTTWKSYGSTALTHLHGGSGVERPIPVEVPAWCHLLEADGNGTLPSNRGPRFPQMVAVLLAPSCGGGDPWIHRLAGKSITNNGSIQAKHLPPMTEVLAVAVGLLKLLDKLG